MKKLTYIISLLVILTGISLADSFSQSTHMNSRRITWNSSETNGTYDIQWARSVKGPWHDTWDEMLDLPATNGVMTVDAPHFFRVVHRPLPPDQVESYIGYRWNCYRTKWDIGKEWVQSLPEPRDGFNYGINGDGRGANITTHENDKLWTDYTVEFDLELQGIDPSFNPYNVDLDFRNTAIFFRLKDMSETQYDSDLTAYALTVRQTSWALSRLVDYSHAGGGSVTTLAEGSSTADLSSLIHIQISCIENHLTASINDVEICSYTDNSPSALSYGGIGLRFHHECMGRFKNMKITHHTEE